MISTNRFRERVNDGEFCRIWQTAANVYEAADALGVTPNAAKIRASQLRKRGRSLKKFPPVRIAYPKRRLGRGDDSPGLRTDGRPNHKPKSDYCPGVDLSGGLTELEFDEALAAINDPRVPLFDREMLAELTTEIYRRAAVIREARPAKATLEDRKRPVDVTVIPSSEVFDSRR